MRRSFVITISATLALTACGGGAPPVPQSNQIAPATTQTVAVTITAVEPNTRTMPGAAILLESVVQPTATVIVTPAAVAADAAVASVIPSVDPLDIVACEQLWGEVSQMLGVDVDRSDASFHDERVGNGTSCRLVAMGNGAQFKPFTDVAADLRALLSQRDWTEDQAFAADGPTGTSTAYRRGASVALVSVGWQPEDGVNCDGPIAECEVPAAQQRFTVSLDLVEPVE